ncbi:MAG: hypothetical protein WBI07_17295 [Mobilitalea sp.]
MKNTARKLLVFLLIATMSIFSFSGCKAKDSDTTKTDETDTTETDTTGTEEKVTSFTYFMHGKFVNWLNDLSWYTYVDEATGVTPELVSGPEDDAGFYAEVDQRLISKTYPDAGIAKLSQAQIYGSQGAFLDLKPLIDKYAPDIKAYIEANPDYAKLITTEDGAIYGLPTENPVFADLIGYRADHLEKAGITTLPTTLDEFTEMLRQLKTFYGATNENYYPLSGRDSFIKWAAYFDCTANFNDGVAKGISFNANSTGNGVQSGTDVLAEGYKAMVEWYKVLYNEGLIDPEWVAGASTEESWEAKVLTGQTSVFYDFFTRPQWFTDNGGADQDPDFKLAVLDYPKNYKGEVTKVSTPQKWAEGRSTVINASSEDKAETILSYLNFFFTEEGQTLANWGVEGESFKVGASGNEYIVNYSEQETTPVGEDRWSFLNDRLTFVKPVDNTAFYAWNGDVVKGAAARCFVPENLASLANVAYNTEQMTELASIASTIQDTVVAETIKFVTGDRDMGEWDSFIADIKEQGYSRVVEVEQAAYDTMYK